jgi:UDP-glucose 4-epimerase
MRALVTGGAGFIGSNLAKLLLEEGHEVVILDNLTTGYQANIDGLEQVAADLKARPQQGRDLAAAGLTFIKGDVRDADAVEHAMGGCEVVFHLAASVGNKRSIENPIEDSEINVIGTLRVLEAARRLGVRKVVYSSSAAAFGELKRLPIAEDHPAEPDSPYGASKLAAEKMCLAYAKLFGLETICLRYFNVYGVNQRYDAYGNVIPIFATRMLEGSLITIFGDGEQTRDFINVRDVAMANYKAALATGVWGAFNIGSGTRVTVNRLVELMGHAGGLAPRVQHGQPRAGDVRHSLADVTAATNAFGFRPTVGLSEGLWEYVDWAGAEAVREAAKAVGRTRLVHGHTTGAVRRSRLAHGRTSVPREKRVAQAGAGR